ncbi:MAG: DUF2634 domain-containing protein [Oscillospiraceae bacterium]|nr:DUF2634 domain-containing protein [Oscillospiraceae bacterium]
MIPMRVDLGELARERLAATTFYLDEASGTVRGMVDGQEAVRQAVFLLLHTERYLHVIYSFDYGTELAGLGGNLDSFLFPEIKRRVTEALLVDDRISGTSDFVFRRQRTRVEVRFTVHTIYGDLEMELEV